MTLLELQKELHQSYGVAEFWATTNFGRQQILGDNKFWATTKANVGSQRLPQQCGYDLVEPPSSPLYSYDFGDLVFHRGYPA
jgi:hypothetical protein